MAKRDEFTAATRRAADILVAFVIGCGQNRGVEVRGMQDGNLDFLGAAKTLFDLSRRCGDQQKNDRET